MPPASASATSTRGSGSIAVVYMPVSPPHAHATRVPREPRVGASRLARALTRNRPRAKRSTTASSCRRRGRRSGASCPPQPLRPPYLAASAGGDQHRHRPAAVRGRLPDRRVVAAPRVPSRDISLGQSRARAGARLGAPRSVRGHDRARRRARPRWCSATACSSIPPTSCSRCGTWAATSSTRRSRVSRDGIVVGAARRSTSSAARTSCRPRGAIRTRCGSISTRGDAGERFKMAGYDLDARTLCGCDLAPTACTGATSA